MRYWAASSKLGTDAAFDPQNPKQIKVGRRLAIKVLNAAKFVYGFELPTGAHQVTEALDIDMLAALGTVVDQATAAFDAYDHARALEVTERFFWTFCDDYLELVKERAYGTAPDAGHETQASAVLALRGAIDVLLRLLAPFLPYATEEVWAWTHDTSVHRASWPVRDDLPVDQAETGLLAAVGQALIGIRGAKTAAKASQKTPVTRAVVQAPAAVRELVERAAVDLAAVGRIQDLAFVDGDEFAVVEIELAEQPPA